MEDYGVTENGFIKDLNDAYNRDFMTYSDILFLSNEYIKGNEANFLIEIYKKYNNKIIVVGCGEEGALAYIGAENRFYYSEAKAPKGRHRCHKGKARLPKAGTGAGQAAAGKRRPRSGQV